jgi:hypothetical protein
MHQVARSVIVFLLASSLVIAQNSELLAQSQASAVVNLDNLASHSSAKGPSPYSSRLSFDPTPMAMPAQGSGSSNSRKWFLIAGFAMVGTGAVMAARKEPVHQTVCIAYDACPTPGLIRVTGGIMAATGASIILFKLK